MDGEDTHDEQQLKLRSHRRGHSIMVGGASERHKLQKAHEVQILQSVLEKQTKALEESQEETQLAARIGQSLLLQNQQLDYEMEAKLAVMYGDKLQDLSAKYRELDTLHAHSLDAEATAKNDALEARALVRVLRDELGKSKDNAVALRQNAVEIEALRVRNNELTDETARLRAGLNAMEQQSKDLREVNLEQAQREVKLERQYTAALHQVQELRPQLEALKAEYQATLSELRVMVTEKYETAREDADSAVAQVHALQDDVEQLTEQLEQEKRVTRDLLLRNEELIESIASTPKHSRQPSELPSPLGHTRHSSDLPRLTPGRAQQPNELEYSTLLHHESPLERRRAEILKRGSLFHELSIQLEKEFQRAKETPPKALAPPPCATCPVLMQREAAQTQKVASLTLEVQHLKARLAAIPATEPDEEVIDDILKEFFSLTAAAVKMNGAGLKNDRCNISNEALYAKAIKAGVTFDRFHDWIRHELDCGKGWSRWRHK
ncbi:hypothetical protein ACHHYP_11866 [Achlya hypogyna]|uniref:Uncharacterized protein n=1 Tax=Achlya hypogyna TaxID=1202772 RepID=A0A1V9YI38_ACHHY|nr:hypothetical protein ACHHYP_11866 [Achlya hypogyna]